MANCGGWAAPTIKQLLKETQLEIDFNVDKFDYINVSYSDVSREWRYIKSLSAIILKPSGETRVYHCPLTVASTNLQYEPASFVVDISEKGEYCLTFNLKWYHFETDALGGPEANNEYTVQATGYFSTVANANSSPYTIKTVIDRILSVTPTRTTNGVNKYEFRNNAEEYATEESPEFTFTGKHLFEVMLDIASYKKKFPALYKNEIYFRPFWNGIALTSADLPPPTKAILNSAVDQYCTAIDSYVENMVCINDTNVGTVVEPFKNGYISARAHNTSEISETTSVVPTQSTIYQPITLNVGETNGIIVGDIQSYLYEEGDYESLSDTSMSYPYSKGYALKYTRFSKDFTELAHRIDKGSSEIADSQTRPAIANILNAATNGAVGDTGETLKTFLSNFVGNKTTAPFAELLFQPTYIPVVNARVRQYKPMISTEDYEATLFYNQQSEVVDSEAFGEHVKGLVQKLGNHTEIRVYRFERVDDIPTVGTLIDEKSVYNVAMTIFENHVDVTLCLVDYAELSTYIGVKNEIKTSDISSTKWSNRFINWEEFLVFTHEAYTGNTLSITKDALADIVAFTEAQPLTCATFTTYAESGDSIINAFAPIKHLALGNSIYFQWEMLDNFAVGYKSEKAPDGATSAWTGTKYDRAQRAVRYCDSYGRMEKLDFQLLKAGPTPDNAGWLITEEDLNWTVDENAETITFKLKNKYPCYIIVWFQGAIVDPYSGIPNLVFTPNQTSASMDWGWVADETQFNGAYIYDGSYETDASQKAKMATLAARYIRAKIAHEYPQKPSRLSFYPSSSNSDEEKRPAFQLYDWLIKKNSAEALKFAAQYHFRQTWREFVIGSGMSNFCALVGGSCSQLQMFISALPINRFERHVNLGDTYNYLTLDDLPTFTVDEENKRVEITLPSSVNDYIGTTKSWGLVGIDKNGNRQLIFGENKNAKNEAFLTTIYLVAMQKNNEPQARATYKLSLADTTAHESNVLYSVYVGDDFYGQSGDFEFPRGTEITIKNSHVRGFYFVLDGASTWIGYKKSFTFKLTKDMEYYVWDTYVSPTDPMPM